MIAAPLNDHKCLAQVGEVAAELAREQDTEIQDIAARFGSTEELEAWIRSLPQRDDIGDPGDGPKVDGCDPPQRLRIPAPDPNCFERAALYLAAAELIDPSPVRQLVTVDTPVGPHTFPVEAGEPVVLDPRVPRNALEGALFQIEGGAVKMTANEAADWVASIAEHPASLHRNGIRRVSNARRAMRNLIAGKPVGPGGRDDLGWTLGLAEQQARLFGTRGMRVVRQAARALDYLDSARRTRNALSVGFGRYRVRPDLGTLGALARVGGRLGERAAIAAVRVKLAELGVTEPLLGEVEGELNREGLSLGALARPAPMSGTLGSLTPDALAGRWLASRVL